MKLCKKLFSFILVLSIMLSSVSAFAAPNANESGINEYNLAPGTTVICVEAFVLGWGYVLEPTVVAYNPGETLAQLTARVLAANSLACVMNGAADDDASYIQGIGCPQLAAGASPSVPAYLMTELEAYPDWAEENLGYQPAAGTAPKTATVSSASLNTAISAAGCTLKTMFHFLSAQVRQQLRTTRFTVGCTRFTDTAWISESAMVGACFPNSTTPRTA